MELKDIALVWGTPGDIEMISNGGGDYASSFRLTDSGVRKILDALWKNTESVPASPIAWTSTSVDLPPEGVVVETMISDQHGERNVALLKRNGNLWFVANGAMYVYYYPTHWREAK